MNFGSTSNQNFTGDTQDTVAGLFDTLFRELHPNQGRWLSPDPAHAGWNLYAYVDNNPLTGIDPTGLKRDPELVFLGGGGFAGCSADGVDTPCGMVQSMLGPQTFPGDNSIGGAVQCPNNNCGIGTATPYQCVGSVCGYMSNQYVATHENEYNGILYSNSEWQTFLTNRIGAQQQALADAIVAANQNLDWNTVYGNLRWLYTQGGNANFAYDGNLSDLSFIPGYATGGCEVKCRYGDIPSVHMPGNYILHLDSGNPLWGFGLGALAHGFIDVLLGNINPTVPMGPW